MRFGAYIRLAAKLLCAAALMIAIGCQSHQPAQALPAPPAVLSSANYLGTPLSGPITGDIPAIAPADALTIRVSFISLEHIPARAFDPLGSKARLISASRGGSPVMPSGKLTEDVQVITLKTAADLPPKLQAAGAGKTTAIGSLDGALPMGVTEAFVATDKTTAIDPITGQALQRRIEVEIARTTGVPEAAIVLADTSTDGSTAADARALSAQIGGGPYTASRTNSAGKNPAAAEVSGSAESSGGLPSENPPPTPAGPPSLQIERALLDLPGGDTSCTALIVPFRFDDSLNQATAIVIDISSATNTPAHTAALAQCIDDLKKSNADAAAREKITSGEPSDWSSVQACIASLGIANGRRSALVYLSSQTGAGLCQDTALVAGDDALADLAKQIQSKLSAETAPEDSAAIGWTLDRTTLEFLDQLLNVSTGGTPGAAPGKEPPKMPDELSAVLASYAGEPGRHASSMDEIMRGLVNRQDLENRLLAENLIFLEDSSPASRVRAFDWLSARGKAPAGFDPLGTNESRRDSLEKALSNPAAAQAGGAK